MSAEDAQREAALGLQALRQGVAKTAQVHFEVALALAPASQAGLVAGNHLTGMLYGDGALDRAQAVLDLLLRHHPGRAELWQNRAVLSVEAGDAAAGARDGARAVVLDPTYAQAIAALGQALFRHGAWGSAARALAASVHLDPEDVTCHYGLSVLYEAQGRREKAARHQAEVLRRQQVFPGFHPDPKAPALLILEAPGDFQANLPLGFVLSPKDFALHRYVLLPGDALRSRDALPPYDLVFNAIAEPDKKVVHLGLAQQFLSSERKPVLNPPDLVVATQRDRMATTLAGLKGLIVPKVERMERAAVEGLSITQPILLRPLGAHAGHDLDLIRDDASRDAYLTKVRAASFYRTDFHDYADGAGLYRKYRAILVEGRAYPFHMAIRDTWMVHYYNANMERHPAFRAEEEAYLADMPAKIGLHAIEVLEAIATATKLDYFGVDFAISPDGDVILFEVDVAAIVHMMDDPMIYPYKHVHVPRIIDAMKAMILKRLGRG